MNSQKYRVFYIISRIKPSHHCSKIDISAFCAQPTLHQTITPYTLLIRHILTQRHRAASKAQSVPITYNHTMPPHANCGQSVDFLRPFWCNSLSIKSRRMPYHKKRPTKSHHLPRHNCAHTTPKLRLIFGKEPRRNASPKMHLGSRKAKPDNDPQTAIRLRHMTHRLLCALVALAIVDYQHTGDE